MLRSWDKDIELMFTDIDADVNVMFSFFRHCFCDLTLAKFGLMGPFDCSR